MASEVAPVENRPIFAFVAGEHATKRAVEKQGENHEQGGLGLGRN